MLTPREICEKFTTDEFIALCQIAKPHNFDVLSFRRNDDHYPVVFVKLDNGLRERIEVKPWQILA